MTENDNPNHIHNNHFGTGFHIAHKKGGEYIIINVPARNCLLEHSGEPFYLYQSCKDRIVYARCKSEMEDGRFTEIDPLDRKVSIQKKGDKVIAGLFEGMDCVRDFIEFDSEDRALEQAQSHFGTVNVRIVRPEITSMITSYKKK